MNVQPLTMDVKQPELDERLNSTSTVGLLSQSLADFSNARCHTGSSGCRLSRRTSNIHQCHRSESEDTARATLVVFEGAEKLFRSIHIEEEVDEE